MVNLGSNKYPFLFDICNIIYIFTFKLTDMRQKNELNQCSRLIQDRLNDCCMDLPRNAHVKEGYIKALEILKKKMSDYTVAGIKNLSNTQSRAIAMLAVDYVNGECNILVLTSVPIWAPNIEK